MNAIGSIVSYINGFDKDKEATLMYGLCIKDLISEVCKIKEVNHPGFTKRQSSLVANITKLEDEIGMTLYPHSLKELIKMIGFKDMVQRQVKVQGKIIDKSDYKYNLITSHTARRTFININIQRHKTSIEIRRATGHRTYFGYSKYLCYDAR